MIAYWAVLWAFKAALYLAVYVVRSAWALALFALAWSIIVKRLVTDLTAVWYLSEAAVNRTLSAVIAFLLAADGAAWPLFIETISVFINYPVPVGKFVCGKVFP